MGQDTGDGFFRKVLDHVLDAVVTTDWHGRITYVNPAAERLYGIPKTDAVGRKLTEVLSLFDAGPVGGLNDVTAVMVRDGEWRGEISQRTQCGPDLLVEATVSLLTDEAGEGIGSVSIVREISDRKKVERLIAHQARHDGLTDLLNRKTFMSELTSALDSDSSPSLVFLDLNGFKQVNDLHGHERGDEILQAIAGRLLSAVREDDLVGRFGGDEFVLLLRDVVDPAATEKFLERITSLFSGPVRCRDGTVHSIGASVGVAAARPGDTADSMIRRADGAMYEAKRTAEAASAYCVAH